MDMIEEIRKTIAIFDPELTKNENETENAETNINIDNYQSAIDSAVDPQDLNFSMQNLFDDEDENDLEVDEIPIPQQDYDREPIKIGDSVQKVTRNAVTGTVLAVGELIEVEWDPELVTLEYPEELIHVENNTEEEQDKVKSLDTIPPIPLKDPNL